MNVLQAFLSKLKGKKILVLTHFGADVDSLASAAMLFHALRASYKVGIGVPDKVSASGRKLSVAFKIPLKTNPDLSLFDGIIGVDFNAYEMLGSMQQPLYAFRDSGKPILILDHHFPSKDPLSSKKFIHVESYRVATAEVVYSLLTQAHYNVNADAHALCAIAIVADSANFVVADHSTFSIMAECMKKSRRSYAALMSLFSNDENVSHKLVRLKAAQRARFYSIDKWVLAISEAPLFEADSAYNLIKMGADVSFVAGEKNEEIRLSGRASTPFTQSTKLHLVRDVLAPLALKWNGSAGGHQGAAGFNARNVSMEAVLADCVEFVHAYLKRKAPGVALKKQ